MTSSFPSKFFGGNLYKLSFLRFSGWFEGSIIDKLFKRNYLATSFRRKLGLFEMIEVKRENEQIYKSAGGDALEAFIGAIYLDRGYKDAQAFVINKLIKLHLDLDEILNTDKDYKSKLVEWSQKEKKAIRYEVAAERGNGVNRYYVIDLYVDEIKQTTGNGNSKKLAEQHAAEKYLSDKEI